MRFTTAALFALCSATAFANPIEAPVEARALDARQRVTTSINCEQNPRGNTNDSNNNAKYLQGFGSQTLAVPTSSRQIARTNNTKAEVFNNGKANKSYNVPAQTIAQALLEINYSCGQTGRVAGIGTFPFQDTTIYVIAAPAS